MEGKLYPAGLKPANYFSYYTTKFDKVEVDSAFAALPRGRPFMNGSKRTAKGFVFSAKVPQVVTHEKILVGCDAEFTQFIDTMNILGVELGPLLLQFGYFNKNRLYVRMTFWQGSGRSCELFSRTNSLPGTAARGWRTPPLLRTPPGPVCPDLRSPKPELDGET